ncbi:MAG: hypothetical protein D6722_11650 [Bacteroidetes bacterium]|nr:MAG: hypothetical protein D6722_11650 [Bacteroidota bacterium]
MRDRFYYRLVVMALTLTGLAVLTGFAVLLVFDHPEWLQPKPAIAEAAPPLPPIPAPAPEVVDGIEVATGFIAEGDYQLVSTTCTACHSARLVLQNRATESGWREMIHWMQETQNLWDLGENEDKIVAYLATHYGPEDQGRRAPLTVEEWYVIE